MKTSQEIIAHALANYDGEYFLMVIREVCKRDSISSIAEGVMLPIRDTSNADYAMRSDAIY